MFWRKHDKNINSVEYEQLHKRITELTAKFEEIQIKLSILQTNFDNLRGNFNRKLAGIRKEEEMTKEEETEKDIKKSIFLSPDGKSID